MCPPLASRRPWRSAIVWAEHTIVCMCGNERVRVPCVYWEVCRNGYFKENPFPSSNCRVCVRLLFMMLCRYCSLARVTSGLADVRHNYIAPKRDRIKSRWVTLLCSIPHHLYACMRIWNDRYCRARQHGVRIDFHEHKLSVLSKVWQNFLVYFWPINSHCLFVAFISFNN